MSRAKEWIAEDLRPAFVPTILKGPTRSALRAARPKSRFEVEFGLTLGALLCLLLSGCGMSTLERHTMAAGLLHGGTGVAAQVIEARAQADADAATSEADLTARMERWHRAEAAQHLAAAAVDVYVAEVLAAAVAADSGEPDEERLLRALGEALSVYRALAELLSEYGVELPSVARVLSVVGDAL